MFKSENSVHLLACVPQLYRWHWEWWLHSKIPSKVLSRSFRTRAICKSHRLLRWIYWTMTSIRVWIQSMSTPTEKKGSLLLVVLFWEALKTWGCGIYLGKEVKCNRSLENILTRGFLSMLFVIYYNVNGCLLSQVLAAMTFCANIWGQARTEQTLWNCMPN